MNAGQIVGFLWDVAAVFFLLSVFVFPIVYAYWRAREREDAERTKEVLDSLLQDTTHLHE